MLPAAYLPAVIPDIVSTGISVTYTGDQANLVLSKNRMSKATNVVLRLRPYYTGTSALRDTGPLSAW